MTDAPVELAYVPLRLIDPSPTNPRKTFQGLDELAASIRQVGVQTPIRLRPVHGTDGARYEIVYGERRFRAAQAAGLTVIPATIASYTDREVLELQVVENLLREDVPPAEEADGFHAMLEDREAYPHLSDLADRLGKSVDYIRKRLKLRKLGPAARQALEEGTLSVSIALLVARIPDHDDQAKALDAILSPRWAGGPTMTHREAADYVRSTWQVDMRGAPFNRRSAQLVPEAGSCTACPHRSGNDPETDAGHRNVCFRPDCFDAKVKAHWEQQQARAREAGREVVDDRRARHWIFGTGKDARSAYHSPWRLATDVARVGDGGATWKALLGPAMPEWAAVGRDQQGHVHQLYREKDLVRAARKRGLAVAVESEEDSGHSERQEEFERGRRLAASRRRCTLEALAQAAAGDGSVALWRALLQMKLAEVMEYAEVDLLEEVARQLGVEGEFDPAEFDPMPLLEAAGAARLPRARSCLTYLQAENLVTLQGFAWREGVPDSVGAICRALGVDPKAVEAAAQAAFRAAERGRAAPSKKGRKKAGKDRDAAAAR